MQINLRFILFLSVIVQIHSSDVFVNLPSLTIDEKSICDLSLIGHQSFTPLKDFMNQSDYLSVINSKKLEDTLISEESQTSSFKSKDPTDQLLVIGCGRSGTNYLAKFLEESGYAIYHERPGNNGCVSWTMTVNSYSPWGPITEKTFTHLFHQVRHPLDVISSWAINLPDLTRDEWVFIRNHISEIDSTDSLIVHCAKYWYYWNLLAEKNTEWRFQIEEFPKIIHEFSEHSGLTLESDLLKKIPTNFNSWEQIDKKTTWDDLKEQLPEDLYQKIRKMADRYGYNN